MPGCADMLRFAFRLLIGLAAALMLSLPPALADDAEQAVLDKLFAALRAAPDAQSARTIDRQIWLVWTTPSDPVLRGRINEVLTARAMGDLGGAVTLLDRLVVDYPDYAEAWNQRATMYYMLGELDASIADCAKVLELEPRHFGALSGRALIYLQQGRRALALKDMATALKIHPFLAERRFFPELQRETTRI
jgi:tetratricopeptide (TPR) repeat protein